MPGSIPSSTAKTIRDRAWVAINGGDTKSLCLMIKEFRRITLRAIDDWNKEHTDKLVQIRKKARAKVDQVAREAAAEQCKVEIGNDPKSTGDFADNSGDYVIERVNTYGR